MIITSIAQAGEGRQVAGLRVDGRGWVRLVAPRDDGALYPHHMQLAGVTQVRILDRVLVEATWPDHAHCQPESRLLDGQPMRILERPANLTALAVVRTAVSHGPALLGDGATRWRESWVMELSPATSIELVEPRHLHLTIRVDKELGRRRLQAHFWLAGREWRLPLLDAQLRFRVRSWAEGSYSAEALGLRADRPILAAIAVGSPFQGWCYKAVASLFQLPHAVMRGRTRRPVGVAVGR